MIIENGASHPHHVFKYHPVRKNPGNSWAKQVISKMKNRMIDHRRDESRRYNSFSK